MVEVTLDSLREEVLADTFVGRVTGRVALEKPAGRARYILTSAQNNTVLHDALWKNLNAYADHVGAEILVAEFIYTVDGRVARESKGSAPAVAYAPKIRDYLVSDRVVLSRTLHFAAEMNILPTAENPLSGLSNHTGRASAIYPHAKQAMESVATTAGTSGAKLMWTTGTVTLRNYIQRKSGLKAEYHHAYGALIVEIEADGAWFVRQIRATEDGSFQDLDVIVRNGQVHVGAIVEALLPGDIHVAQMARECQRALFGEGGIVDTLRPRHLFLGDSLDFHSQNHHDRGNPHIAFAKHLKGEASVARELDLTAAFLKSVHRPGQSTIVVDSNHDAALTRWVRENDLSDVPPENATTWLALQTAAYAAIAAGRPMKLYAKAMGDRGVYGVRFMSADESFVICRDSGGIEMGIHGHAGVNGSRGSPRQFARLGRKVSHGHTHSAAIVGDVFVAGTSSILRPGYVSGPSSWSWSHVIHYDNGCRAIVTQVGDRWRGD